jgi:SAM-dependent methyltransferase
MTTEMEKADDSTLKELLKQVGGASRLQQFMARIATETYPEPISEMHSELTRQAMDMVLEVMKEPPLLVLDVGCGQGPALKLFEERMICARGIALNDEDVKVCEEKGFLVNKQDQNDILFADGTFTLVWARHVLEHSIAPLWTLTEFKRVLRPGGWLYVEVPGPDTACVHESNANHYSVLGQRAWYFLLTKAGFEVVQNWKWNLKTGAGPDVYFGFVARKA